MGSMECFHGSISKREGINEYSYVLKSPTQWNRPMTSKVVSWKSSRSRTRGRIILSKCALYICACWNWIIVSARAIHHIISNTWALMFRKQNVYNLNVHHMAYEAPHKVSYTAIFKKLGIALKLLEIWKHWYFVVIVDKSIMKIIIVKYFSRQNSLG